MKFSSNSTRAVVGDWSRFFLNADEKNCPMTSCFLKKGNCQESYNGTLIEMRKTKPWQVTATADAIQGYSDEEFCVDCSNGY